MAVQPYCWPARSLNSINILPKYAISALFSINWWTRLPKLLFARIVHYLSVVSSSRKFASSQRIAIMAKLLSGSWISICLPLG